MQVPSDTRLRLRSWEEGVIWSLASRLLCLAVLQACPLIAIEKFGKNPLVMHSQKGLFVYREDILSSNPGSQLQTMSWGWGGLWLEREISSSWSPFYKRRIPIRLLITQTCPGFSLPREKTWLGMLSLTSLQRGACQGLLCVITKNQSFQDSGLWFLFKICFI